jgi:ring-1,2-phenylacetyl-CoA epoxidase subunit PaaE
MEQNYAILRIAAISQETEDAKTFELQAEDGRILQYLPGQFITLVFLTTHGEKRRSFSISSISSENKICITVKKIPNGEFSRPLIDHYKVGDTLLSAGIAGQFVLSEAVQDQYVFIAAGSGITPCYALIKQILITTEAKVVLYYSNRSEADTIFYEDLKRMQAAAAGRFVIRFLFSNRSSVYEKRLSHWLLLQFLDQDVLMSTDRVQAFVCGSYDYMQMVEIALRSRLKPEQIRKENFDHWPRQRVPEAPDKTEQNVELMFKGKVYNFKTQYPQTVLSVAKSMGIALPYSCEAGRCAACVGTCKSGKIWMAYNEVLTDKEVEQGRILVCQSYPQGGKVQIEVP